MRGDRAALGRAITWVENDEPEAAELLSAIRPKLGRARVVGFTGAPGVGKSTLVGAYVGELRRRGRSAGIIAVDPSSPVSGGAILGDRIRMTAHTSDPDVFVRSIAARGHMGGLALATARVIDLMDAAGKDEVVIETVGAGQSELEVAELADITIVVCAPGFGDEIQAVKAGILEIADILVVNKSDLPHADRLAHTLRGALEIGRQDLPPLVLRCVAKEGGGLDDLADTIDAQRTRERPSRLERTRKLLARAAAVHLEANLRRPGDAEVTALCQAIDSGALSLSDAVGRLLRDGRRSGGNGNPDSKEGRKGL